MWLHHKPGKGIAYWMSEMIIVIITAVAEMKEWGLRG